MARSMMTASDQMDMMKRMMTMPRGTQLMLCQSSTGEKPTVGAAAGSWNIMARVEKWADAAVVMWARITGIFPPGYVER